MGFRVRDKVGVSVRDRVGVRVSDGSIGLSVITRKNADFHVRSDR